MTIAIVGLWHLGCVTAACLAGEGHQVIAWDPDATVRAGLEQGRSPVFEPGLDTLLQKGLLGGNLHIAKDRKAIAAADVVWVTFDTPVDESDRADIEVVMTAVKDIFYCLSPGALLLFSSQLPVGTTRELKRSYKSLYPDQEITVGYIPENLRLGNALKLFMQPERIVVGLEDERDKKRITRILGTLTDHLIWMSIESAEMTKHALNAFLALSVTFINEIASLCELVGADACEVEKGLKSESRIGSKARLSPGGAIAGGTLLRDVMYLEQIAEKHHCEPYLLKGLVKSNAYHKTWLKRKLQKVLVLNQSSTVAVLGLAYKAGTDTLRRSLAVEICQWLSGQGVQVAAWDPKVKSLPVSLQPVIQLKSTMHAALSGADIAIVTTDWPEFRDMNSEEWLAAMRSPRVLDPGGWLMSVLGHDSRIVYQRVGSVC